MPKKIVDYDWFSYAFSHDTNLKYCKKMSVLLTRAVLEIYLSFNSYQILFVIVNVCIYIVSMLRSSDMFQYFIEIHMGECRIVYVCDARENFRI